MIKAIIVDDEINCCEVLELLLQKHCPNVTVVATCNTAAGALEALSKFKVDLVFLDIEMPLCNGFELLEKIPVIDFELIFTTCYNQYAIKAIRFSALDYLLKPIDREELQAAVIKAEQRRQPMIPEQLEILLRKLKHPFGNTQCLALPTLEGLQLVPIDSIICCTSKSNYTILFLKGAHKLVVSKTLKDIEALLGDYNFMRVHHSHMVKLNEIRKYIKGEGGQLIMSDGSSIDVSRSRKEFLLKKLQSF
ncbi:MAG TPA: LytTR family DNA-binding domain-containing protein [Chitinophagaceae bacterium]|jgi:two-component system LytT family response regulator|nr:LytTR family DNA-binding domain-containing protein [Chitinophagaceae bacterium]